MKAWRALLVAEFRRAAGFLPWQVGLHGLKLGARTRWAWDISPQSLALLEWASWTVAALVVGLSLWQDAPLRRDRFLATRPHRLAMLVTAKALALWGIAVLPFVAVECAALRWNGMAGEVVILGTLQLAAWLTALLAAAFPLVWWWSTRRMAVAGLLTGVGAALLTTLALSRLPGNRNIYSGTPWTVPVSPLSVLGTVGLFALGGCLLLPLLRARGGMLRGLAFSALVGLSVWGGLVMSLRQAPADEIMPASLVDLSVQCEKYQSGDFDMLSITVPGEPLPESTERTWRIAKLAVNGRNITPWPSGWPGFPQGMNFRRALQERVDRPLKWIYSISAGPEQPLREALPGDHTRERRMRLELAVLETRYAWQVVADLPANVGATARSDDAQWRLAKLPEGSTRASIMDTIITETCQAHLWPGSSSAWRGDGGGSDILVLVDRTNGQVVPVIPNGVTLRASGADLRPLTTALRHQRARAQLWVLDREAPVNWNHEIRLMVVRPKVVRRILHSWRSREQITLPVQPPSPAGLTPPAKPGTESPIAAWLAAHPVPGEGTSAAAARAWWEDLSAYLAGGMNVRALSDSGLKRAAVRLVASHPEEALDAYRRADWCYHHEHELLHDAIAAYLTRDKLGRLPTWHTDPLVVALAVSKGWLPVIADAVTRSVRSGSVNAMNVALTSAPEIFGLSEAEWLDFFRLRPLGATYQALADKVVPRAVLDREIERMLGPQRTRQAGAGSATLLELALASGRREGPEWLRADIASYPFLPGDRAETIAKHFVIPDLRAVHGRRIDEQLREWFLVQDVSRFAYDPQTRKYHLSPP